jgi:hypothetical protein
VVVLKELLYESSFSNKEECTKDFAAFFCYFVYQDWRTVFFWKYSTKKDLEVVIIVLGEISF